MKPSEVLELHRERIRELVEAYGMSNPRVFGSAARGEDDDLSDLDLLIDLGPDTTLFSMGGLYDELTKLLGLEIDLVSSSSIPSKFRERVLEDAIAL